MVIQIKDNVYIKSLMLKPLTFKEDTISWQQSLKSKNGHKVVLM